MLSCFDISLLSVLQNLKNTILKNLKPKIFEKLIEKLIEIFILFYYNEVTI